MLYKLQCQGRVFTAHVSFTKKQQNIKGYILSKSWVRSYSMW
jgi:hypothetical protein